MTATKIEPTVPLAEFGLTYLYAADRDAWARTARVKIVEDYLGRPAVSLADAYKIRAAAQAAEAEAAKQTALRSTVHNAEQERDLLYDKVYSEAMARVTLVTPGGYDEDTRVAQPANPGKARAEAIAAARKFEASLPREVRELMNALPAWPTLAF